MYVKKSNLGFRLYGLIYLINKIKYINFANHTDGDILTLRCSFLNRNMLQSFYYVNKTSEGRT